jgi:probable phosphoglycerate mutase
MGGWEDVAWGDIEHDEPEMNWCFSMDPARWRVAGSESFHDVQTRMKDSILEIAKRHDAGTVAIVSHGFAIRSLICWILGIESSEIKKVSYYDNTAVSLLIYDNDIPTIEYKGDNTHLSSENSTFANQTWWRSKNERISENIRFLPLEGNNDSKILKQLRQEAEEKGNEYVDNKAYKEYTAILNGEQVGALGLNTNTARDTQGFMIGQGRGHSRGHSEGHDVLDDTVAGEAGWIDYIYVKPELRRHNYGIQLIGQAVSVFRKLRRDKLRVIIEHNHPAIDFFEKFSFVKIADNNGQYVMEKNIQNWV